MATPTPASTPNTTPPPAAPAGPKDLTIKAGKVMVLVDASNSVMIYKVCTHDTRIFTSWSINQYADEATAKADIAAKGWKFTPPATVTPPVPAPATSAPATPAK
jgi:hypothetical protein